MRRVLRGIDLPASVRLETGPGDLLRLGVDHERFGAAEVYLHGAHVTGWTPPGGGPVLWLSAQSHFRPDAAIRGGVPICFPWFGAGPADDRTPSHGYARLRDWRLASVIEEDDGVTLALVLPVQDGDLPLEATYLVTVGAALGLALEVRNAGDEAVTFEEALHTYLAVSDVRQVAVEGLDGARYLDRLGGPEPVVQEEEAIRFEAETDRIYVETDVAVVVADPGAGRRITVAKSGSSNTVVWNPWADKARGMADFGDDEWPGMVCVETANVRTGAITLAPGETHLMTARIEVAAG